MASPLLAGIPISSRFAEKLGMAQEKQDQQQMTHTKASTQEDKSWDQTLYEKSDIYRSIKDAYTAPIRAWKGEIDPYSDQGVMEAINLAGVGMGGSIPGGARGVGSFGVVDSPSFLKLFPDFNNTKLRGDTGDLKILYHGTSKDTDFKNFKKSPRGTWLSESPEEASSYAMSNDSMRSPYNPDTRQFEPKNTASRVIPVYVKAEKIYQLTPEELHSYQYAKSYSTAQKQIIAKAEREGYDAVDFGGGVYSVIDPKNIRSAISPGERKDVDLISPKPNAQEGLNEISSPIQDLEASVKEQVKQLDNTGWNRLPGAAGKRDSDVQLTFLQKMYKEHPDLVRSKPSELEKLEIKLRRIYKLPEKEIEDIMLPLWSTSLRNQKPEDSAEEHTQKTKMKRRT